MIAEDFGRICLLAHREVRTIGYKYHFEIQIALYDIKTKLKNSDLKTRKERCVWDIMAKMVKMNQPDIKDVCIGNTFKSKQQDVPGTPWE
ncbi:MAG: hypothetical protein C0401_05800 [Anaerolinea sp.]|nr:hypothetical protein [Anaerolinea sp.]